MNLNKINVLRLKYQQIRTFYKFVKISEITKQNVNDKLNIKGWIKGHRNMKSNIFLDINDGSCHNLLQIVINKKQNENHHKELHLGYGASIDVSGILKETPKGQLELNIDNYHVIGKCTLSDGYPFVPKQQHTPEYIREYLHLRPRYHLISSILRVRHMAINAFNNYLHNNGYFNVHTPVITTNDCEGAGEAFTIQPDNQNLLKQMQKDGVELTESFFDKKVYLSVSGQLHLESMCYGLGNVYSFGPTFRAENSKSPVHLTEFYMLELEQSFIQSLSELCSITERMIKQVTETLLNTTIADIENIRNLYNTSAGNNENQKQDIDNAFQWLHKPFVHLTYKEALEILEKHNKIQNINSSSSSSRNASSAESMMMMMAGGGGLSKEQELFLVNYTDKCPIFLIDWPMKMKPFYMRQKSSNLNLVEAFDLLVPTIGELIGGSLREDNFERLRERTPSDLNWYLELRKFGGITTGGFGMGFERYLQFLLNVTNIKDCIPFPRWPHNCSL